MNPTLTPILATPTLATPTGAVDLTVILAHQGGWDEFLLVALPLVLIGLLLWIANRRVSAQLAAAASEAAAAADDAPDAAGADDPDDAAADPDPDSTASPD